MQQLARTISTKVDRTRYDRPQLSARYDEARNQLGESDNPHRSQEDDDNDDDDDPRNQNASESGGKLLVKKISNQVFLTLLRSCGNVNVDGLLLLIVPPWWIMLPLLVARSL